MNERIQAIKNQCWVYRYWDKNGERWVDRHVDLDKFAELIVRECAQFTDSGIRKFLLEHFGIEQ